MTCSICLIRTILLSDGRGGNEEELGEDSVHNSHAADICKMFVLDYNALVELYARLSY